LFLPFFNFFNVRVHVFLSSALRSVYEVDYRRRVNVRPLFTHCQLRILEYGFSPPFFPQIRFTSPQFQLTWRFKGITSATMRIFVLFGPFYGSLPGLHGSSLATEAESPCFQMAAHPLTPLPSSSIFLSSEPFNLTPTRRLQAIFSFLNFFSDPVIIK